MRSRVLTAMGIGVTSLALATTFVGTASAASPTTAGGSGAAATVPGTQAVCFENMTGDTGTAITSQNFEAAFDAYDNSGADDFKVKRKCAISSIVAPGQYYNGVGPAASETVTIYKNKDGAPGKVLKTQTVTGADSAGTFDMTFSPKLKVKKGKYWLGVVANLDFGTGGQWGWENTSTASGAAAMWQNPGDGFGSGCTTWANMQTCLGGVAPGPDFMFSINK